MATKQQQYLTIPEVSSILRVDRRTVYAQINAGRLRAVRIGRQYRVRPTDLDKFADRQTVGGGA